MDAIKNRKSVRRYKADKIDKETIKELLVAATMAPNGSNSQQWDFIVVDEPMKVDKIAELIATAHKEYFGQARVDAMEGERLVKIVSMYENLKNVPVFVIFCINMRNKVLQPDYEKYSDLWAQHSIAAAMENFLLAATEKGFGTCWFGAPAWRSEQIKNLLGIPASVEIAAITPVGYADGNNGTRPRLPIEQVMHENHW